MNGTTDSGLAQIQTQIMWNRLISVVEEQAQTLLRTAFSTTVREAGDLSAGVFDTRGRMLAQAVTGTPGHVNSMANGVKHFLARYPNEAMRDGDVYITNDPWLTCGHLHDLTVVTPVFRAGRIIGSFACTAHVVDIGGRGFGPDARSVFEEGLYIPIMPLVREGRINEDLLEMVRWNVREPLQLEGDVHSLIACNRAGADRLLAMMDEFGLADLDSLGAEIVERSRAATLAAIAELPRGTWRNTLTMDGYDEPITLAAAMTVSGEGIHVDFSGTSPASNHGINVVLNYTTAYTSFGLKCIVAKDVPNNAGSLAPLTVSAPEGSILNAPRPWPVAARHVVGHMLPDLVFGCLHQAIPERVPAEGAASLWIVQLRGGATAIDSEARRNAAGRAAGVRGRALQLGRRRRAADQGRALCHRLPQRRAHHAGGGHRDGGAHRHLAQGAGLGHRRRRRAPGRPRPGDRDRRRRRRALQRARAVRAHRQPRARPGRRARRRARHHRARRRHGPARQGAADDPARQAAPADAPGRRRPRRPPPARRRRRGGGRANDLVSPEAARRDYAVAVSGSGTLDEPATEALRPAAGAQPRRRRAARGGRRRRELRDAAPRRRAASCSGCSPCATCARASARRAAAWCTRSTASASTCTRASCSAWWARAAPARA